MKKIIKNTLEKVYKNIVVHWSYESIVPSTKNTEYHTREKQKRLQEGYHILFSKICLYTTPYISWFYILSSYETHFKTPHRRFHKIGRPFYIENNCICLYKGFHYLSIRWVLILYFKYIIYYLCVHVLNILSYFTYVLVSACVCLKFYTFSLSSHV